MSKEKGFIGAVILTIIGLGLFIVLPTWFYIHFETNHHFITLTVNKSERVVDQDGKGSRYLIFTDKGVFENSDSLLNNKWNSSDLYNDIKVGKTYTCDLVGFRNGFFSTYENIIRCK